MTAMTLAARPKGSRSGTGSGSPPGGPTRLPLGCFVSATHPPPDSVRAVVITFCLRAGFNRAGGLSCLASRVEFVLEPVELRLPPGRVFELPLGAKPVLRRLPVGLPFLDPYFVRPLADGVFAWFFSHRI